MNHKVDIGIYVKATDAANIEKMSTSIKHMLGVAHVRVNRFIDRLIMVEYDPAHITSKSILKSLRKDGMSGMLVGM